MKSIVEAEAGEVLAARKTVKPVNFYFQAPGAKAVFLAGDFNRWSNTALPMKTRVDGWWFVQVELPHGHHQYRLMVDGKPMLDPRASGIARNPAGEEVSVVAVS